MKTSSKTLTDATAQPHAALELLHKRDALNFNHHFKKHTAKCCEFLTSQKVLDKAFYAAHSSLTRSRALEAGRRLGSLPLAVSDDHGFVSALGPEWLRGARVQSRAIRYSGAGDN